MADQREVDDTATVELFGELLRAIRRHYNSRPASRDTVCEVLNALAAATAEVLNGTGPAPDARRFFEDALALNCSQEGAHG